MMADQEKTMQRLGELFMVGLPGPELDASTLRLINEFGICHFILFKRNVIEPGQIRRLCVSLKEACLAQGLPAPLISIDQEGGTVARLSAPFTCFPDARKLAEDPRAEELLASFGQISAAELTSIGVNMNLAPVLDVCPAGESLVMERRSLGSDPQRVAGLGVLVINAMQQAGLAACAKHFPGLGSVRLDPHEHLPMIERTRSEMAACDLVPFQAAMAAGVAAVMTSHTIYPAYDSQNPATLSARILTGLLREELGYEGLVITDDLEMGAIENDGLVAEAGLAAFLAGADMLLICHDHLKIMDAYRKLQEACGAVVSAERLKKSLDRVDAVRSRFVRS